MFSCTMTHTHLIQNISVTYDSVNALSVVALYELYVYIYLIDVSVSCAISKK